MVRNINGFMWKKGTGNYCATHGGTHIVTANGELTLCSCHGDFSTEVLNENKTQGTWWPGDYKKVKQGDCQHFDTICGIPVVHECGCPVHMRFKWNPKHEIVGILCDRIAKTTHHPHLCHKKGGFGVRRKRHTPAYKEWNKHFTAHKVCQKCLRETVHAGEELACSPGRYLCMCHTDAVRSGNAFKEIGGLPIAVNVAPTGHGPRCDPDELGASLFLCKSLKTGDLQFLFRAHGGA